MGGIVVATMAVPGTPVPKARARVTSRGAYTPKRTVNYERAVSLCGMASMSGLRLETGPIEIRAWFLMPIPTSWSKKKKRLALGGQVYHTAKPDVDNMMKAVCDGLEGVVYKNDSQAVLKLGVKRYSEEPMTLIKITRADDETTSIPWPWGTE